MIMELFEIYEDIAHVSDGILENEIEYSYDALMGIMGASRPNETLDYILTKIDWDTDSPDIDLLSEAYDELIEFNKCFKVKELKAPIRILKKFLHK